MSDKSNNQGRAYEYACILELQKSISALRPAVIINNSSLEAARRAWDSVPASLRLTLTTSARAAVGALFDLERRMIEDGDDTVELLIQKDKKGEEGDVRDILIIRRDIRWEIGLSIKHNHFAVKHSRLSKGLDFGQSWFGDKCSQEYWREIAPIFQKLEDKEKEGVLWRDLLNKATDVYVPLLRAFIAEVKRAYSKDKEVPRKMVEYLLGKYDFYKVISEDRKQATLIQAINIHETLAQPDESGNGPTQGIPVTNLPTRIVSIDMKPGSDTTVELYLDEGWQFSFRIHNAKDYVEPSLKFDIQILGMPTTLVTIEQKWGNHND